MKTIEESKEAIAAKYAALSDVDPFTMREGTNVFIRTAVMNYIGTVIAVQECNGKPICVALNPCVWVADTERLGEWLATGATGANAEYERYPGMVRVNIEILGDWTEWLHPVPETK